MALEPYLCCIFNCSRESVLSHDALLWQQALVNGLIVFWPLAPHSKINSERFLVSPSSVIPVAQTFVMHFPFTAAPWVLVKMKRVGDIYIYLYVKFQILPWLFLDKILLFFHYQIYAVLPRGLPEKNLAPVRKSRCPYEMETNALKSTKNQSLDRVNCSLETSIMNAVNQREEGSVPVNVLKRSLCQIV